VDGYRHEMILFKSAARHVNTTQKPLSLRPIGLLSQELHLNKHLSTLAFAIGIVLSFCCVSTSVADVDQATAEYEATGLTGYPRSEYFEQGDVQVHFPTLDSWVGFQFLTAWLPVEVTLKGSTETNIGSVYVQAETSIDFDQRTVSIANLEVLKTKFSADKDLETISALAAQAFMGRESIVPLDVLLRLLSDDFEIPEQGVEASALNFDPPVIVVSETPLKLLSIDKEPVRAPVDGTELEYVVNTNWNVFYYRPDERWYVLNDGTWQQNNYLATGGWTATDQLPADFNRLALSENATDIQKAIPAKLPESPPIPFAVSLQATELIVTEGAPRLNVIEKTGIRYVTNTESDLFTYENRWYFLTSGRWFSNKGLDGPWQSVKSLPDAFARIPSEHKKANVLYSVPGTRQAKLSMIEAALPHRVTIAKSDAAKLQVSWAGEPRFEAIDTTQLERGLNTPFQVIKHNNFYYLCHEGAWYFSDSPEGSWKPAEQIPDEIYRIPTSDPAFNVTFVKVDSQKDKSEEYVHYSYSNGYTGSFSTKVSVVYGTGWYYPSNVYWNAARRPVYWPYASTYGYNVGYHPVGSYYGGRSRYYGGYGGWGRYGWGGYGGWGVQSTVTIESPTVDFKQGYGSAWEGPLQTTPGDPSKVDENSLDQFLPKKRASGNEEFVDTSKDAKPAKLSASSLYMGSTSTSNTYSGPNGEVYKRDENESWSQYSEGNWETMNAMQQNQQLAPRPQRRKEAANPNRFIPAHKKTLSRGELDQQEMARLEGMDNYSKYRMEQDNN
jgi:hypothetical protein